MRIDTRLTSFSFFLSNQRTDFGCGFLVIKTQYEVVVYYF